MMKIKVLTLVGGISRESINKKLFSAIRDMDLSNFEFITFDIAKLPFFSQDLEIDPPDQVTTYKELIREANAVLFITPEYNRSLPGVLKNAIDWGSRPYGMNLWQKKPAAILGASVGNVGTFGAQHHLRQVLTYLNMYTLGQPEFYFNATDAFDKDGKLINPKTEHLLIKFFDAFLDLITLFQAPKQPENQGRYKARGLEDSPAAH
jgi:NAD(P)H-dependent FMN reductase